MGATSTPRARIAALFLLPLAAGLGCQAASPGLGRLGGWDRDVSGRTEAWGGYRQRGEYELSRDVFLLDVPERTNGPGLVPGRESAVPPGTLRGPAAVSDYRANPERFRGILGLVPAGTRLRAETLRAKGNLRDAAATRHYVKARVLNGEFGGRKVDLEAVSLYGANPDGGPAALTGPNGEFLRQVR